MEKGTVKWYDREKKYGFISSGGKDYFVHVSDIEDLDGMLDEGEMVEFEIGEGKKGPIAKSVRKTNQ